MMTACFTIFRRSPTTFRRFLKILQNLSEGHTHVAEHFPIVSEDFQRLPKVVEEFRGRADDVSIIHQRIYLVHLYSALFIASLAGASATRDFKSWRIWLESELCQLKNGSSSPTSTGTPIFFPFNVIS